MLGAGLQGASIFSCFLPIDSGFGARLLELCNQGLFECLALNLHCLGGQQMELAAVINGRIVSTNQLSSPAFCFLRFPFFLVSCTFHFSSSNYHIYPLIPFKSWLKVLCCKSAFCLSASYVPWGESVLGELADHYDGPEAAGGPGAHACGPRRHPQICAQGR